MSSLPSRISGALTGRYVLERELGAGGMATVYLAEDLRHDRQVAIKVLPPGARRRHRRRALPRRDQDAPPTCSIRTSCRCSTRARRDGYLFYVMPFVEGESLRDRLHPREAAPDRRRAPDRHRSRLRRSTTPTATA